MFAAVYLLWVGAAPAQEPSAAESATVQKQTQRVAGRVISALDEHPLAHATVSLEQIKARQNVLSTTTDGEGRYSFDAVPTGKYTLLGQASGYESATYLSHEQYGTAIVTGAGLATDALVLRLTPLASISGRILDAAGDPVAEATVELYRTNPNSSSDRIARFRADQTSDRGDYEFDRLPPGRYFIGAEGVPWYAVHPQPDLVNGAFAYAVNVDPQLDVAYPMVFYPHALDSDEATPIDLKGGEQVAANLQMQPVPAVSLHVMLPAGEPRERGFPQFTHMVFGLEEPVQMRSFSMYNDQGVISGLAPGQYHVQLVQGGLRRSAASVGDIDLTSGSNALDLSKASEMASLSLTVHGSGEDALPKRLQVTVRGVGGNQPAQSSALDEKGTATIQNLLPGDYRLQLNGGRRVVSVLSMSVNGKPVGDKLIHIVGSGNVSAELTATTFAANVDGFVRREGKADAASMVELIPAGADMSESLFRRDQSDLDGSFMFPNVVPGKYLIVAIDDGWPLHWSDPVALAPYLVHAVPLEVLESGPKQMTLIKPVAPQLR